MLAKESVQQGVASRKQAHEKPSKTRSPIAMTG